MQKKLSLLAAGLLASLTINSSFLHAADAPAASGNMTAPAMAPAMSMSSNATMAAPAMAGNMTASASMAGTPVDGADLTKLPKASDKTGLTYDKDIAPIFKASCVGCHGTVGANGAARRPASGLDLSSLATALKGGTQAKAKDIAPGHADQSLVVLRSVAGAYPGNVMPRGGAPLTADQIGLIMAWINQGAK